MYVGDMVQSVQTKVSYKSKKKKSLPKSNWDIVKNTHEPLVDRFIFESVQNNIKRTTKTTIAKREKRLFENLLYCKECGKIMIIGLLIVIDIQGILKEECVSLISVRMKN